MGTVSFMGIILKIFFIALIVISIIAIIKNKGMKKIVVLPLILEALSVFGLAFADVAEFIIRSSALPILSKLPEWTFVASRMSRCRKRMSAFVAAKYGMIRMKASERRQTIASTASVVIMQQSSFVPKSALSRTRGSCSRSSAHW